VKKIFSETAQIQVFYWLAKFDIGKAQSVALWLGSGFSLARGISGSSY
jgi:hypothetical protein